MLKRLSAALALALSCLVAAPVLALERPATCATLFSVLQAAKPGDVVKVAAGDCAAINAPSASTRFRVAAPGVVVEPDGSGSVSIAGLTLNLWEGFTFRDLTIRGPVYSSQGRRIALERLKILGLEQGWETATANGVKLVGVQDFALVDSIISGWGNGVTVAGINSTDPAKQRPAERVTIARNRIERIAWDGIRGFDFSRDNVVEDNLLTDFSPVKAAHLDAIQLPPGSSEGLVIRRNRYTGGATGATRQGIFIQGQHARVTIEDNVMTSLSYYGLALDGVRSGTVRGNFMQSAPGYFNKLVINAGVEASDNTIAAPGDDAALARWSARFDPPPPPRTLEQRVEALEAAVAKLATAR